MAVTPLNCQRGEFVLVWSPGSHSAIPVWEVIVLARAVLAVSIPGLEMLQLDPEPRRASAPSCNRQRGSPMVFVGKIRLFIDACYPFPIWCTCCEIVTARDSQRTLYSRLETKLGSQVISRQAAEPGTEAVGWRTDIVQETQLYSKYETTK